MAERQAVSQGLRNAGKPDRDFLFNWWTDNIWNFGNLTVSGCLFEEGYQWPLGLRGVAGAMIYRCKDFLFVDSEWGFVSIGNPGNVSADGQSFDLEGNCTNVVLRNCLFHDTDGPGLMMCQGCATGNRDIRFENCVLNGKAMRVNENGYPRVEIFNTPAGANQAEWRNCRFYLAPGVSLIPGYGGTTPWAGSPT